MGRNKYSKGVKSETTVYAAFEIILLFNTTGSSEDTRTTLAAERNIWKER